MITHPTPTNIPTTLHLLVEAELPVEIIDARLMQANEILEDLLKPIDEAQDMYTKQQLRELALLNGMLRDEGFPMSPFNDSLGLKRAKTRGYHELFAIVLRKADQVWSTSKESPEAKDHV